MNKNLLIMASVFLSLTSSVFAAEQSKKKPKPQNGASAQMILPQNGPTDTANLVTSTDKPTSVINSDGDAKIAHQTATKPSLFIAQDDLASIPPNQMAGSVSDGDAKIIAEKSLPDEWEYASSSDDDSDGSGDESHKSARSEQITSLSMLTKLVDNFRYHATESHEDYFMRHARDNTLKEVLPAGIDQRHKAGRALLELAAKLKKNLPKDYASRISELLEIAKPHNIAFNKSDLDVVELQLRERKKLIEKALGKIKHAQKLPSQTANGPHNQKNGHSKHVKSKKTTGVGMANGHSNGHSAIAGAVITDKGDGKRSAT